MRMRILSHGNDDGSILLLAILVILAVTYLFMSYVPYSLVLQKRAEATKTSVLRNVENENREVMEKNELY